MDHYKQILKNNNFIDMFDIPIRKKARNYPKDFTPPPGYYNSQSSQKQKHAINSEKSNYTCITNFRSKRSHNIELNRSTQLQQLQKNSKNSQNNIHFTINPQENKSRELADLEKQSPLIRHNLSKKQPYLNPELLTKPRIQQNSDKQLIQIQEQDGQQGTPGSIKKNINPQKPLQQQLPSYINVPAKNIFSTRKLQSNENTFYQSLKSQYSNFNNLKQKKLQTFLKGGFTQPQGVFKLAKKHSDSRIIQSNLHTPRQKSEQKNKLLQFGPLLQQKRLDKLKAHINQIAFDKIKQKQKVNPTTQTQADNVHGILQQANNTKRRSKSNFVDNFQINHNQNNYPQLEHQQNTERGYVQDFQRNRFDTEKQSQSRFYSTPKLADQRPNAKKVIISYKKTSLNQLKQLFINLSRNNSAEIQITIPNILMNLNFNRNAQKSQLYNQAAELFAFLELPTENISVKRYSNCILIVSRNICILWHYDGKVYLGGWQNKYLDEGVKHGLGLQWVPNKHTYYGQFVNSKKQGLGILKTKQQTYFGQWHKGKKNDNGHVIYRNGQIQNQNQFYRVSQHNQKFEGFETDPFQ